MARVTKDPEERRNEILDAAQELFMSKGFEETAVSDIVKKVGVAQGTFYYYFETKDAVLNAVLDRFMTYITGIFEGIAENPELDALQKIQAMLNFDAIFQFASGADTLTAYVHREENIALHQRFMDKFFAALIPILAKVISQGVREGHYNTAYPVETVEILLMGLGGYFHRYYFGDQQVFENKKRAMEDILERLLGAFHIRMQS